MAIVENSVIAEITRLPLEGNIQVKWRNTIEKDGVVIASTDHYKLYSAATKSDFLAEVPGAENDVVAMGW